MRHETLQALLATVEGEQRPHFVRYVDDLGAMSQQVAQAGVAALAPVQTETALFQGFRALLELSGQSLADAPVETGLPFSPIQRNLMAWQSRDSVDVIALHGWYTAAELQLAFAHPSPTLRILGTEIGSASNPTALASIGAAWTF